MKTPVTLAAILLAATAAKAAPIEWTTASGGNGHFYDIVFGSFSPEQAFLDAATKSTPALDAYVATVTSAAEWSFIYDNLNPNRELAWLGGSDRDSEGDWIWINGPETGEAIGGANYDAWSSGEPNDFQTGEDFMAGWWGLNGQFWNDLSGGNTANYVIEYSAAAPVVPVPAGLPMMVSALLGLALWRRRSA